MMLKICFVIPEISHIENNDVPLSVFHYATELSKDSNVTVLYTSTSNDDMRDFWKEKYFQAGVKFKSLTAGDVAHPLSANDLFFRNSYAVFKWLECRTFDLIVFTDFYAPGFHTIQAKKTTSLFDKTSLAILMLGTSEYIMEHRKKWCSNPVFDIRLQYAEKYCCENTDVIMSTTKYLLSWAKNKGWQLPVAQHHIDSCFNRVQAEVSRKKVTAGQIAFWGNHEDYTDIKIFCEAMVCLNKRNARIKISFLFNSILTDLNKTAECIDSLLSNSRFEYTINNTYDIPRTIEYIKDQGSFVIIMSATGDNQFIIRECIKQGIPFVAASSRCLHELLDERLLFEPTVAALTEKLKKDPMMTLSDKSEEEMTHAGFFENLCLNKKSKHKTSENPKVSVCVAYYNHGKYLPMLLESLEQNTYPNFEVIVVDDGSTDRQSISVFNKMANKYKTNGYRFYSKENEFIGKTRNYAVQRATGDYIIFADADDIAAPDMIEKFVTGIIQSGCDCLAGYMRYFEGEDKMEEAVISKAVYSPTGPILELALFENCIGGVNIIINKETFVKAGGFGGERLCYEDWRFLIKLAQKGYRLDVVPSVLYYYRILPNSMNRSKNEYDSKAWLVSAYYEDMPPYMEPLIKSFCIPSWDMWMDNLNGNVTTGDNDKCSEEYHNDTEKRKDIDSMGIFSIIKYLIVRVFKRIFH